jgi:hypothetical protein
MITLSDDKSAYGTLKGLVRQLELDVQEKRLQLHSYSERSRDYAACSGAIGALNMTISLITVSDVWVAGLRADQQAMPKHIHAEHIDTNVGTQRATLYTDADVQQYLRNNGAEGASTWEAFVEHGISFTRCDDPHCKLARSAPKTD